MCARVNSDSFLMLGKEIAERSLGVFWEEHLRETGKNPLNLDQYSFKGIYLHYLSEFVTVLRYGMLQRALCLCLCLSLSLSLIQSRSLSLLLILSLSPSPDLFLSISLSLPQNLSPSLFLTLTVFALVTV